MQVGWDDDAVARKSNDKVKFKKDKIERICVMDAEGYMKYTHWRGGYVECTAMALVEEMDPATNKPVRAFRKGPPCRFCELSLKPDREPEERFASHIIIYGTDQDAMPLTPLTFALKWWSFGKNHFTTLRTYRKNFGDIRMRDILVTCTNEEYQHLQLTPTPDAWWLMNEQFKAMVAEKYKNSRLELEKLLATHVPYDQQNAWIQRADERDAKGPQGRYQNNQSRGGSGRPQSNNGSSILVSGGQMPSFNASSFGPPPGVGATIPFGGSEHSAGMPALNLPPSPFAQGSLANMPLPPPVAAPFIPPLPSPTPGQGGAPDLDGLLAQLEGNKSAS